MWVADTWHVFSYICVGVALYCTVVFVRHLELCQSWNIVYSVCGDKKSGSRPDSYAVLLQLLGAYQLYALNRVTRNQWTAISGLRTLSWYAELIVVGPEIHNYASIVKVIVTPQSKYQSYSRRRSETPRIRYFDTGRYFSCDLDYATLHSHLTLTFLSSLYKYFLFCC